MTDVTVYSGVHDLWCTYDIDQLRQFVAEMDTAYDAGTPIAEDAAYDHLVKRLAACEEVIRDTADVEPMLSVPKTYTLDGVREFVDRIRKECGQDTRFCVEPKLDGCAVAIEYRGGRLYEARTMGRGGKPRIVTDHVLCAGLPDTLPDVHNMEIRGEMVIYRDDFEALLRRELNDGKPHNARNIVAGALAANDPEAARRMRLRFFAHGYGYASPSSKYSVNDHFSFLDAMMELRICIPMPETSRWEQRRIVECVADVSERFFSYETDGVVVKVDSFALRKKIGSTARYHKWAIAWKHECQQADAIITAIEDSVAPTGTVTPVAVLAAPDDGTITLGGTTITRATLHNHDYVRRNGYAVGDRVIIERRGNVIPKIVGKVGNGEADPLLQKGNDHE